MTRTGAINWVSNLITHWGKGRKDLIFLLLMTSVGLLSAFINNTATVAVFLPVTLNIAYKHRISPSKLLIPLSYASIFAGTFTLIGTSINILVSAITETHGLGAISMFKLSKLGIIFWGVGMFYLFFVARKILPHRASIESLTRKYRMKNYLTEILINEKSPLIGKTVAETRLNARFDINVLEIIREKQHLWVGIRNTQLHAGDILLVRGSPEDLIKMRDTQTVSIL